MSVDLSSFTFDGAELHNVQDFVAEVRSGVVSKRRLLDVLKRELQLPDYFGENWDALDECLRDLSWITAHRVIILHQELPQLASRELLTYLDVLSRCVQDWKASENHTLIVVFPQDARETINKIISADISGSM